MSNQQPSVSSKKSRGSDGFTGEFCLTVKEGIDTSLPQTVPKTEEGLLTTHFMVLRQLQKSEFGPLL